MAENGDISGIPADGKKSRGNYNIAKREWGKREIRKLLIAGHTNDEISDKLKIPKRTLERYLHDMFAEDNQLLDQPSKEELLTQLNIFRTQIAGQLQDVLEIAKDKTQEGGVRLEAHNLAAEFGFARFNIVIKTADYVARRIKIGPSKLIEEQKGLNIRLVRDPRSQLPSHYEVVNNDGNDNGKNNNNNNNNNNTSSQAL